MKVISITPRGYCKGVVNAINIAKQTKKANPNKNVYILGRLVHNQYVVDELAKLGIHTIDAKNATRMDLLDKIDEGIIIFSAHGVGKDVYNKAIKKGLQIIDATCVDVRKTKDIILDFLNKGFVVLYIGKKNHPEAEAILSISDKIIFVSDEADLDKTKSFDPDKLMVINQTTMSIIDIMHIHQKIKNMYPNAIIYEEICSATRVRQEAVLNMVNVDLTYVVGDPHSNNTNNLAKLAKLNSKKVRLIESVAHINLTDLINIERVAVTSGASTPISLTNQVISFLQNYKPGDSVPEVVKEII